MKTKILQITTNLFLTILIMTISFSSFGQNRNSNSRGNTMYSRGSATVSRNANNSRQQRTIVENRRPAITQSSRNPEQARTNNPKPVNNSGNHGNNHYGHKDYNSNGHSWNNDQNAYASGWRMNNYRTHNYYPKTYSVWNFPAPWAYSSHAIVFRHDHGDYYFCNNRFYRYDPFRGYYMVDYPGGVIFSYLPVGFQEVMWNGAIYYRYGNIYLEYTPVGYVVVGPSSGIYLSANTNF